MATVTKFQDFSEQLNRGVHNFGTNTYRLALTNTAPTATQTSFDSATAHPPPTAANGYPAGGATVTITIAETGGTTTITGGSVTFTATAGGIGPFRYYILYNDSATTPAKAPVQFWDHGSSVTLNGAGDQFVVNFNNTSPTGTILTLT